MMSDPIADMLTRVRNANQNKSVKVSMPTSKMKAEIARILKEEGFINDFTVVGKGPKKELTIFLKYTESGERVITGLRKISKPGLRVNVNALSIPQVLKGLGIAIMSTSKGLMTGHKAKELGVGGEVIAYVW